MHRILIGAVGVDKIELEYGDMNEHVVVEVM